MRISDWSSDVCSSDLWNKGVPACFSCHGPSGFGVAPGFPSIAAQHAPYVARQLDAWKGGTRTNSPLSMMQKIAAKLSDGDIRAVADYLATDRKSTRLNSSH